MPIFRAPEDISYRNPALQSIFLAGSIEMDKAINWQQECENKLGEIANIFNPRRLEWDSSWKQEIENPQFRQQVEWELEALEQADIILLFFDANTKSPISLLEFGLHARSGKLRVICQEGFWRKGNVDIVCHKYQIPQFETLEAALDSISTALIK